MQKGVIELDFSNVYGSEKHSVMHKWAALANIEKKEGEVLGYIKFSVSVITEGDETVYFFFAWRSLSQ